jgi:hypothetical protein
MEYFNFFSFPLPLADPPYPRAGFVAMRVHSTHHAALAAESDQRGPPACWPRIVTQGDT